MTPYPGGSVRHAYQNNGSSGGNSSTVEVVNVSVDGNTDVFVYPELIGKAVQVFREGFFVHFGNAYDECTFDGTTGTVTFNTTPKAIERIAIYGF